MLIALGRAIGVLIAHADQRGGKSGSGPGWYPAGEDNRASTAVSGNPCSTRLKASSRAAASSGSWPYTSVALRCVRLHTALMLALSRSGSRKSINRMSGRRAVARRGVLAVPAASAHLR